MNTMLSPQLRELYYLGALESPGSWLIRAIQLKSAAERLDWMRFPAREEERGFDHFHEYSMLLGMSFEALIKGHISRARILSKIDPVLMREHFTHDLRSLAQCPECAHLSFTVPELEELAWLSQFIEWAGRYPMPRKAGAMEVGFGTTDSQYHLQKDLWDRVHASLRADAWVMKSGPENLGGLKKQVGQPAT